MDHVWQQDTFWVRYLGAVGNQYQVWCGRRGWPLGRTENVVNTYGDRRRAVELALRQREHARQLPSEVWLRKLIEQGGKLPPWSHPYTRCVLRILRLVEAQVPRERVVGWLSSELALNHEELLVNLYVNRERVGENQSRERQRGMIGITLHADPSIERQPWMIEAHDGRGSTSVTSPPSPREDLNQLLAQHLVQYL